MSSSKLKKTSLQETKLGQLPITWSEYRGKDLFVNRKQKGTDELPVLSVTINSGLVLRNKLMRKMGNTVAGSKSLLVEKNDIAYNMMRMWQGAMGLAQFNAVVSPAYVVLRGIKELIDPDFSILLLKSPRYIHLLKSYSYGLTKDRLRLYFKDFALIPFIIPQLPTQKKIVGIVKTWGKSIELSTSLIKEKMIRYDWILNNIISQSKTQSTASLGDLGKTFGGLSGKSKEDFGMGKRYINYMNIFSNSKIKTDDYELVKVDESEKQNTVEYGDIFFTTSSETPEELGMSSVLLDQVGELYLNSFCFGFRLKDFNTVSPEYLRFYLRSNKFRRKVVKIAQGSTRFNLSKKQLLKIKIPVPSLIEQKRISTILDNAETEMQLMNNKLIHQIEQKKGIVQRLLNGSNTL